MMYINSSFFRNSRSVVFSVLVYFYFCFCSVHNWASSNALATNTNGDTEYDCAFVFGLWLRRKTEVAFLLIDYRQGNPFKM